jgi:hypothetical protein
MEGKGTNEVDRELETEPIEAGDGTRNAPSQFYFEGRWRELEDGEARWAEWLRRILAVTSHAPFVRCFPAHDPGLNTQEANHRAALRDIVDEICREDLHVLYMVARLLLGSHREGRGPLEMMVLKKTYTILDLRAQGYAEYTSHHLKDLDTLVRRLEVVNAHDVDATIQNVEAILAEAWGSSHNSA